jgi:acetyltransferase-like isoleucine patch superfamily enzyme
MENLFFDKKDLKYCGQNVIIGKTVRIRKPHAVTIGDNVIIDDFTYIACELEIDTYSHISANVDFIGGAGKVTIGKFTAISAGCKIVTGTSNYLGGELSLPTLPPEFSVGSIIEPIIISDFVLLGCNTVVLPGAIIPEGMATGALSLVTKKKYNPWELYIGIPCKFHRKRDGTAIKISSRKILNMDDYKEH